jgi:propanol-preferring alcohol dehydrogenase
MRGIVLPGNQKAHVRDWELEPDLGPNDVLIDIEAAALCRSDMSLYNGDPLVGSGENEQYVPGHEPAGTITETGSNADWLEPGDRVAVNCFIGCEHCEHCLHGDPMLCPDVEILGFDRHGGDAEQLVTPAVTCHPMPDEMSMATGAVSTDALGNLFSAMRDANVDATDTVGIVGLGPMGLSGVLNADAFGATVVAFELVDERREKGLELGADFGIDPSEENPQAEVDAITDGAGFDIVVECSGSPAGIEMALDLVGKHGTVAQIGEVHGTDASIRPSEQLIRKKASYVGSWYFTRDEWPAIAEFIVDDIGNDRAEQIISHRYPLEDTAVQEAFQRFDKHETQKVLFTP